MQSGEVDRMSETQKRDKDRRKLSELWQAIEPAKNEEIARTALGLAEHYLIKAENQARQIQNLERRNQPTRGKWVKWFGKQCWGWECSVCGNKPLLKYDSDVKSAFCPFCGARMTEGGEDENR